MLFPLIIIAKLLSLFSRILGWGAGGTWPGELILRFDPTILSKMAGKTKRGVVLIAGTNGKTTTAKMICALLKEVSVKRQDTPRIIHNDSGANLANGLVSAYIKSFNFWGKIEADWAVLETDENTLPTVIPYLKNQRLTIVLLNLFRDQLDRYGEVDAIAKKWASSLATLPEEATLVLNADDPQIAMLGRSLKCRVIYFGINDKTKFLPINEYATDSTYCLSCGERLTYKGVYFSHLGDWYCLKCGNKRPELNISRWQSALPGLYNQYNTLAAVAVAKHLGVDDDLIRQVISDFRPAFGRQEEFDIGGKTVKIFLAKNPAGFNASLRTVLTFNPKCILLVLNDRIPDGRDVSWIWDVDIEMILQNIPIIVSGDRTYDMGLRIKYSQSRKSKVESQKYGKLRICENLREAIGEGLNDIKNGETLYILPTYSAMLEVRKILTGRKIL